MQLCFRKKQDQAQSPGEHHDWLLCGNTHEQSGIGQKNMTYDNQSNKNVVQSKCFF